ncbi:hypothetical protein [Poseidonibacter sp.]|uniref:hypothetical protein n=1 Tax=Poseidonibacter sp. TaxID=2321188 RepID=UPI003C78B24C
MQVVSKIKNNTFYTHKAFNGKYISRLENKVENINVVGFSKDTITKAKLSALRFKEEVKNECLYTK